MLNNRLEDRVEIQSGEIFGIQFSFIPDQLVTYSGPAENSVTRQEWVLPDLVSVGSSSLALPPFSNPYQGLALSQANTVLAVGTSTGVIEIWDAVNASLQQSLTGHSSGIFDLAFSPDGSLLASGSDDRTTRLWETTTFQTRFILRGHKDLVTSLAFSPDNQYIANESRSEGLGLAKNHWRSTKPSGMSCCASLGSVPEVWNKSSVPAAPSNFGT